MSVNPLQILVLTVLLLGLPMLGVWLGGIDTAQYLEFPPQTRYVRHAPFDWTAFLLTVAVGLSSLAALAWQLVRDQKSRSRTMPVSRFFPWWGWMGLVLMSISWGFAWNRFPWFTDWQSMTFTPLWLGYIVVINAWTFERSGRCLLTHERRFFLALFPLSALFWWYFEYLNRFVQNWFYTGVEDFSPARYVLHATLAFSTVLPAVISTREWLASFLQTAPRPVRFTMELGSMQRYAIALLVVSSAALLLLGRLPNLLFPFLWIAPLLLLLGLQGLRGQPDLLQQFRTDGWQVIYLPALAALQCGFLWEMWNYFSVAKWIYTVPFVQRFHVFEMPVAGFTGYLPFGIECAAIALLLAGLRNR